MTVIDLEQLRQWEGRQETASDVIEPAKVRAMAATLDWADPPGAGDELPKPWHWLYFLPTARHPAPRRGPPWKPAPYA